MRSDEFDEANSIFTERLELRAATTATIEAGLQGPTALGQALGTRVTSSWPPEFFDAPALRYTQDWLSDNPESAEWGLYFMIARAPDPRENVLVGACGFKGAPDDEGMVELGYSIVPEWQGRGLATEAVHGLVSFAIGRSEVRRVVAQTLTSLPRSIRVLEKTGFVFIGESSDPEAPPGETVLRYEFDRSLIEQ